MRSGVRGSAPPSRPDGRVPGDGCRRMEGVGVETSARAGTDAGAGRRAEQGNTACNAYAAHGGAAAVRGVV